jgi:hypothetical protein
MPRQLTVRTRGLGVSVTTRASVAVPCGAPIDRDARPIRTPARTIEVAVLAPNRQRFGRGVLPVEDRNGQRRTTSSRRVAL